MGYTVDQQFWIWLSSVQGLGPGRFDLLLEKSGPPQQVWEECGPWMRDIIGPAAYAALAMARSKDYLGRLLDLIDKSGAIAVTRLDPEYPELLLAAADAPATLYVMGRAALSDRRSLAVVGSRNCTAYGSRMARRIARDLSRVGVTIVSGLARGIDGQAHRGAIDAGGRTVAVLGCGVDVVYPPEHRLLYDEILQNGGSVVSEYLPGASPHPHHFPARNRIISGMSQGVLLIEAAEGSGAMGTVRFALDQGREVLALPGQADSPQSKMPHALIRDGAHLVASAVDVFAEMQWSAGAAPLPGGPHRVTGALPMTLAEQGVWNALAGGPADTDALVELLSIPQKELNSLLTIMELQCLIRKLPGRKVERINRMEE